MIRLALSTSTNSGVGDRALGRLNQNESNDEFGGISPLERGGPIIAIQNGIRIPPTAGMLSATEPANDFLTHVLLTLRGATWRMVALNTASNPRADTTSTKVQDPSNADPLKNDPVLDANRAVSRSSVCFFVRN